MGGRALAQRGTQVRSQRAELRRAIQEGDVDGYQVLAGEHAAWEQIAQAMPTLGLMQALPGVGPVTAALVLEELHIPDHVRLYGLTRERRRQVADLLRSRAEQ